MLKSTVKSEVFELYKKIGKRNTRRKKETVKETFSKGAVVLRDDKEGFIYSWERQIDACGQCSYGTLHVTSPLAVTQLTRHRDYRRNNSRAKRQLARRVLATR